MRERERRTRPPGEAGEAEGVMRAAENTSEEGRVERACAVRDEQDGVVISTCPGKEEEGAEEEQEETSSRHWSSENPRERGGLSP